jgi:hypothetical protein
MTIPILGKDEHDYETDGHCPLCNLSFHVMIRGFIGGVTNELVDKMVPVAQAAPLLQMGQAHARETRGV